MHSSLQQPTMDMTSDFLSSAYHIQLAGACKVAGWPSNVAHGTAEHKAPTWHDVELQALASRRVVLAPDTLGLSFTCLAECVQQPGGHMHS